MSSFRVSYGAVSPLAHNSWSAGGFRSLTQAAFLCARALVVVHTAWDVFTLPGMCSSLDLLKWFLLAPQLYLIQALGSLPALFASTC